MKNCTGRRLAGVLPPLSERRLRIGPAGFTRRHRGQVIGRVPRLPITRDLVSRLSPTRSADVRASRVYCSRLYTEGTDVREGQIPFPIDLAPQAAVEVAEAELAGGGQRHHARVREAHRELVATGAVSKSDLIPPRRMSDHGQQVLQATPVCGRRASIWDMPRSARPSPDAPASSASPKAHWSARKSRRC
jgi:hypothetical protein